MKRSKTLFSITLVLVTLFAGCEEETIGEGDRIVYDHQLSLTSTVHFCNPELCYNLLGKEELKRSELQGNGTSHVEFLPEFDLSLSHVALEDPIQNTIQFVKGEFKLYGDGCHLYGTYEGQNSKPIKS